jgi:hypothetical protein
MKLCLRKRAAEDSLEDRARSYRRFAPKTAIDTRGKGGAGLQFLSISVSRKLFCYMFATRSHLLAYGGVRYPKLR